MKRGNGFKDVTGQRFGRLVVISFERNPTYTRASWRCRCDCGSEAVVVGSKLRNGHTKSCGCITKDNPPARTHGMRKRPEYAVWHSMLARCRNQKNSHYRHYGGRGIRVCERWQRFESFYADMGPRPSPDHSIERKDTNGDYCPENCIWATPEVQQRNTRSNRILIWQGRKATVAEWAERLGIPYDRLYKRWRLGMPPERIFTVKLPRGPAKGAKHKYPRKRAPKPDNRQPDFPLLSSPRENI